MKIQSLREIGVDGPFSVRAEPPARSGPSICTFTLPRHPQLAQRLDRFAAERNHILPVLLEFNVGGEESKSGWDASNEARWNMLLPDIAAVLDLPNIRVHGLMTMPPLGTDPEQSRRFFLRLRLLRDHLARQYPQQIGVSSRWAQVQIMLSQWRRAPPSSE